MPICEKCERMLPTSEVRRRKAPHVGKWRCKDKIACKRAIEKAK